MSKKSVKIVSLIITVVMVLMLATPAVFAAGKNIGGVNLDVDKTVNGSENIAAAGSSILSIIRTVGVIIAVGVLMVLGVKYMMGSAEEKASYKKTMVPYIVGAVLIFAASNIATYVYEFASTGF